MSKNEPMVIVGEKGFEFHQNNYDEERNLLSSVIAHGVTPKELIRNLQSMIDYLEEEYM